MEKRIEVRDLTFSYTRGKGEPVFSDISFSAGEGEVFCILGPNGTGKSTLLKCLSGILRPGKGKVLIKGSELHKMEQSLVARTMAYVPQSHTTVFPFTVRDVIVMGRTPYLSLISSPTEKDHRIAMCAMETVGVTHLADRPCTEISGGEWQLVLIARALTQQPDIILLDEPTSHLDLGNQMRILNVISALARAGLTIIMASHFPDHALLRSSQTTILKDRHFTVNGLPDQIITEKSMHETYGINVHVRSMEDQVNRRVCIPLLDKREISLSWMGK